MVYQVRQVLQQLDTGDARGMSLPQALCRTWFQASPVTGAAVMLFDGQGSLSLVAATDQLTAKVEDLHFAVGEGPYLDCARGARPVLQPRLRVTGPGRWPWFAAAALRVGVEAVFAFPVFDGLAMVGVLGLVRAEPGMLSTDDVARALVYSKAAARVVIGLQDLVPAEGGLHPDLVPFPDRALVYQATGMISLQAGVTLDQALSLLRARSFSDDRSTMAIARDVVARNTDFSQTYRQAENPSYRRRDHD